MEADRVDRVDLVGEVEVGVEAVHHHHHLVGFRATLLGIDDEGAVEAAGDVAGQRRDVAVVEVHAERLGVEFVGEVLAWGDRAAAAVFADPRHAVHQRRVDAVEVDRVGVLGGVDEADPQPLALAGPQGRTGDAAVVGPGLVLDPRGDFDLAVLGDDRPLAHDASAGQAPGLAVVEVAQQLGRVEAVGAVVDRARLARSRRG